MIRVAPTSGRRTGSAPPDRMTARRVRVARARIGAENGITLTEMLVVMVILIVLGGMLTLFLSASNSQIDQTNRVDAQLNARLALDSLRRELRCASGIPVISGVPATPSSVDHVARLLPEAGGRGSATFTWCAPEGSPPSRCGDTRERHARAPGKESRVAHLEHDLHLQPLDVRAGDRGAARSAWNWERPSTTVSSACRGTHTSSRL